MSARLGGTDQRAEHFGALRVAPAEIVEQSDAIRIGPDGDDIAGRLIDGMSGHQIWVEIAEVRIDAAADG